MRVVVIHNLRAGGARRRLSEQITRLDADVVELCPSTATPITETPSVMRVNQHAPRAARLLRVPLRYADLAALLWTWRRIGDRVRELGADVVYANPCRYLQAPAALLRDLPPSLYFCDEPRRVDAELSARASRNATTRPLYAPMYRAEREADRRSVARATAVATNSGYTAAQIHRLYGRNAEVVPMGVPDLFFQAQPRPPEHVLSVGTLIPSKGHDIAIAAVASATPAWPLVIVSPRPDQGESERLQSLARAAGVQLDIRVGISDEELIQAYAAAQATLYMAEREPFGLASLEAQAAGSPVIVAGEGGLPETIQEGRGGWAVARAAEAIGERLRELERPGLREAMSAAARQHAARATWGRSARAVETILERLRASGR
jgi:glycosyltransferase involved in cell wall biosynthesis